MPQINQRRWISLLRLPNRFWIIRQLHNQCILSYKSAPASFPIAFEWSVNTKFEPKQIRQEISNKSNFCINVECEYNLWKVVKRAEELWMLLTPDLQVVDSFLKLCNFWSFSLGGWMLLAVWALNSEDAECVENEGKSLYL